MKKLFKTLAAALCLGACVSSFALGGGRKAAADLYWTTMEELDNRTPECALILEEAKIKNMTEWGYYNVDGLDVWYFSGDGTATANPEIRFVTDGTQTQTKPYTLVPQQVERFSFSYRIENNGEKGVADIEEVNYIVQILSSDGSYPIIAPEIKADGTWHTITVNGFTPVQNTSFGASTYADIQDMFCGFLFKMGGLDGELMISNVEIVSRGAVLPPLNPYEEELPETSEEPEVSETPDVSEESDSESKDIWLESEWEEPASDSLWVDTEEEASLNDVTSEPAIPNEGVLEMLGCNSTVSGASVLFALAGVGIVAAIRKRKE